MSAIENADIADASMWKRDPNAFVEALIAAGFIDNPGKILHDWDDYAGKLISRREKRRDDNREAQRRHRAKTSLSQQNVIADHADSKHTTVPNPTVPNHIIKNIKKDDRKTYGEFNNVLLTDVQRANLNVAFGESGAEEKIERLSAGIASKGYKYKNHYATILNWERMNKNKEAGNGAYRGNPKGTKLPAKYTEPPYDPRLEAFAEADRRNSEGT